MKFNLSDVYFGKRNVYFGIFVFLIAAFVIGTPLTLNFLGLDVMSDEQYRIWKVVHGYSIFLGVINYFFGLVIDRLRVTNQLKNLASLSFIIAATFGSFGRIVLVLVAAYDSLGIFVSFGETIFFVVGLAVFLYGQTRD